MQIKRSNSPGAPATLGPSMSAADCSLGHRLQRQGDVAAHMECSPAGAILQPQWWDGQCFSPHMCNEPDGAYLLSLIKSMYEGHGARLRVQDQPPGPG